MLLIVCNFKKRAETAMRIRWPITKASSARQLLPVRLIATDEFTDGSFVAPNPWRRFNAETPEGELVGRVSYGISPLRDRLYVDGLHVEDHHRREGYGTSILAAVAKACAVDDKRIPMTALHETCAAQQFWTKMRKGAVPGLTVTRDVRVSEMADEAKRWKSAAMEERSATASAVSPGRNGVGVGPQGAAQRELAPLDRSTSG